MSEICSWCNGEGARLHKWSTTIAVCCMQPSGNECCGSPVPEEVQHEEWEECQMCDASGHSTELLDTRYSQEKDDD